MYIDFPMSQENITLDSLLALLLYKQSICKFSPVPGRDERYLNIWDRHLEILLSCFLDFPMLMGGNTK